MWFKNGLKAQKLLAQGILPLQGDKFVSVITQGDAQG